MAAAVFPILRNRITDHHRRRTIRAGIFAVFTPRGDADEGRPAQEEQVADVRHLEPEYRAQLDGSTAD
jgi:hypothetical protein